MTEVLFDTPWWLPALLAAVGLVLFMTGNARVENRVRLAGVAVVCLAILLVAVSYAVDTPRETAERKTRELCYAFERADWPAMTAILDPQTAVTVLSANVYQDRDAIMAGAKSAHDKYGFKNVAILNATAEQVQSQITVTIVLLSEQNSFANTLNSTWQFEWRQSQEGWFLYEVRAVQIGQNTGDQIRGMFPGK